jgi:3-oxoacyl-[acyl-carrier protein] reductase
MDLGIRGRTALVCASTSGLGEATARALAAEGAKVVITGRRGDLAAKIASDLPEAIGVEVDITAPDGPATAVDAARKAFGPVDILVLNGPGPRPGGAASLTDADLVGAVDTLLLPHQRLISLVLDGMRQRRWGRILAVGSSGIVAPIPTLALSNAGRAALAGYLKSLATEIAADGVTVNLLLPGRIATDRTTSLDAAQAERDGRTPEEVAAASTAGIPARRYGRPEEYGAVAAFLCSDAASYVTGTAVRCDGGNVPVL